VRVIGHSLIEILQSGQCDGFAGQAPFASARPTEVLTSAIVSSAGRRDRTRRTAYAQASVRRGGRGAKKRAPIMARFIAMASRRSSGANPPGNFAPHARRVICAALGMLPFCAAPISAQPTVSDSPTLHGRIEAAAKMLQNNPRLKGLTEQQPIDRVEFVAANSLVLLLHKLGHVHIAEKRSVKRRRGCGASPWRRNNGLSPTGGIGRLPRNARRRRPRWPGNPLGSFDARQARPIRR
jgi:hypothetical protein